jgi:hypothetical protein
MGRKMGIGGRTHQIRIDHVKTDFGENPKKGNDPSGKLDPAVCLLAGG